MTLPGGFIAAYVRANCRCPPNIIALGTGHGDQCPLSAVDELDVGWYTICRFGVAKRDGGEGVRWTCTCGEHPEIPGKVTGFSTCRHMKALFAGNVAEVDDHKTALGPGLKAGGYYVKLTPEGEELLRPTWATNALRSMIDDGGTKKRRRRR